MTLTARTGMRKCGKAWPDADAALSSKRFLGGGWELASGNCPCGRVHLVRVALGARTVKPAGRKDTGPDAATRATVYTRDGGACVCCGTPIKGRPRSVGHRKRRSQGGTNELTNLVTFLGLGTDAGNPDDHHARIDSRKDPHDAAKGYTCQSWEDPAEVPVMYFDQSGCGVSLYLEADGGLTQEAPEGVVA